MADETKTVEAGQGQADAGQNTTGAQTDNAADVAAMASAAGEPAVDAGAGETMVPLSALRGVRDELKNLKGETELTRAQLAEAREALRAARTAGQPPSREPEPRAPEVVDPFEGLRDGEIPDGGAIRRALAAVVNTVQAAQFENSPLKAKLQKTWVTLQAKHPGLAQALNNTGPAGLKILAELSGVVDPEVAPAKPAGGNGSGAGTGGDDKIAAALAKVDAVLAAAARPTSAASVTGGRPSGGTDRFKTMSDADLEKEIQLAKDKNRGA